MPFFSLKKKKSPLSNSTITSSQSNFSEIGEYDPQTNSPIKSNEKGSKHKKSRSVSKNNQLEAMKFFNGLPTSSVHSLPTHF